MWTDVLNWTSVGGFLPTVELGLRWVGLQEHVKGLTQLVPMEMGQDCCLLRTVTQEVREDGSPGVMFRPGMRSQQRKPETLPTVRRCALRGAGYNYVLFIWTFVYTTRGEPR